MSGPSRPGPTERLGLILTIVALASALGPFSNTIYGPNLVAIRDDFGTTNTLAGAIFSVFAFVLAFFQLLAGPLADRFSAKRLLVGGLYLYSAASVLAFFAPSIQVFLAARALQAVGVATGLVVGGAIVTDRYPPARRGKAMGTLQTFNAIGGTMGPLVGSAIAVAFAWQVNSLALVVAGMLVAVAATFFLPEVAAPAQRLTAAAVVAVIRFPPTGAVLLMSFMQYLAQFTFVAFMPVVARDMLGVPEAWIGWLFLPHTLGVLVGAQLGGRLADRYGARRLLFIGSWLSALFTAIYAATVLAGPFGWTLIPLTIFHGGYAFSLGLGIPAQFALMVERFSKSRGAAVGTYASIRYFGGAAGPLVSGLVLDRFGLASGFGVAALSMVVGTMVGHVLINRGGRGEEQVSA